MVKKKWEVVDDEKKKNIKKMKKEKLVTAVCGNQWRRNEKWRWREEEREEMKMKKKIQKLYEYSTIVLREESNEERREKYLYL